jgi:hypothetical protein
MPSMVVMAMVVMALALALALAPALALALALAVAVMSIIARRSNGARIAGAVHVLHFFTVEVTHGRSPVYSGVFL